MRPPPTRDTIARMKYLDAPFWLAVSAALLLASAASCFALAASAQAEARAAMASL